ncbi:superoxide dismutase [Mycotypha africana]|uniref:superoxide dismutase n=1 Tax=Mycotypha africana TaxID=64632 RepID=UPI002301C99E|nr:superoxide dismutase [Mycotypha africana]KAI8991066.1 superoxide dismutase [Mycotypha africana]
MSSKIFKTEFAVEMTCDVSYKTPPSLVCKKLKETGRTVIVRGQGVPDGQGHSGAAVCIFECYGSDPLAVIPKGKSGLARFIQVDPETCLIDLTVEGLTPGKHGVHIHEAGDISEGWKSTGDHYNPTNEKHGDGVHTGHIGDLGNIEVDENGWGDLVVESTRVKVWDIIGRSMVISENEDDLKDDTKDGNSGNGVFCGIIARSAGAFENTKMVCACSGNTLWQEARMLENKAQ